MALTYPQNGDLTKSLKSARKKVPQSARLSAGGGGRLLFGQCPNRGGAIFKGASLIRQDKQYEYFGSKIWLRESTGEEFTGPIFSMT